MRLGYLTTLGFSVLTLLPACSSSSSDAADDVGTGGLSAGSAGSPSAGKPGTGGTFSGTSGAGGSGNATTLGGNAGSGTGATAGTPSAGAGAGGSPGGSGGMGTAGSGTAGTGTGGSMPQGGAGGSGATAGMATAGTAGASGSAGSGGTPSTVMSGLPVPPGEANQPKPSGTGDTITVVPWAGFKSAVTYSFDDNTGSQLMYFDRLMALEVPFTFFLWTGQQSANDAKWMTAFSRGHEMANHTQSHQSNGTGQDIDAATNFIKQKFGIDPYTMAAPNGAAGYTNLAKGKFIINRGVSNAVIMPNGNSDPFTLPTHIPNTGAGAGALDGEVNSARTAGGWRTMCIHGFQGVNDGAYQPISIDGFETHVKSVKALKDVWIGTMTDVGAYWLGEKAFRAATTMTSGTDKTWTWTLPDKFPPKKYLRVKVAGGTLKQNGAPLAWDAHGYYEISLDAKSVTLSP